MKVKTNLTPSELEKVSKGLSLLAKSQVKESIPTENNAEKELIRQCSHLFDVMLNDLQEGVGKLFRE